MVSRWQDPPSRLKCPNCITPMAVARVEFDQPKQEFRTGLIHCGLESSAAHPSTVLCIVCCRFMPRILSTSAFRAQRHYEVTCFFSA